MLTKRLQFDDEVLEVIRSMEWDDDGRLGRITGGMLERNLYTRTNKALEAMGGKWNRKAGGHVFATDPRPQVEGLIESGELTVERDGFFETPRAVVERMLELVPLPDDPFDLILEPSAGLGAIARHLHGNMTLIEKNPQRCEELRKTFKNVLCLDFLTLNVTPHGNYYARIYMNPPFENMQDIDHVRHAYNCLSENGSLVSVMSESPFFRTDAKAQAFRDWLREVDGYTERLPEGSFRESGTGVNTRLVVIHKAAK
jgi:hypothetical protein